jgi:hypothetical protein
MTKRNPVSALQNIWFDAQQVDDSDLNLEQQYNDTVTSSIVNNHIGTGALLETLSRVTIFDSSLESGFLDGTPISPQNQPTDTNLGNQLEITLSDSEASGKKAIKLCIIGLDFESNLQYETFYFKANEIQITKKHYASVLVLLFNDFIGDSSYSFNLGGKFVIKEAKPLSLSRSPVMVSQELQPNLFFRDFFVDGFSSLSALLSSALPLYNVDSLNITTTEKDSKVLSKDDVTTQIGQKFKATTNNIQKVTMLLAVRNQEIGSENDLVWNGDLVVSIYPLQSSLECPTDIAPNLDIEFSPSNIPIAQLSINYATLASSGVILDSIPQPVDFVFSNSPVAGGTVLSVGKYYAVTVKRSGSANKCDILLSVGNDLIEDSRVTTFTGSLWVDIPEEDLWFKVWTDAAKVSDGQAYDTGHGIAVPKTLDGIDHCLDNLQFIGNDVYRAVLSAQTTESDAVEDKRTGNPVLSRKQFTPKVDLLNSIDIVNLQDASEPLLLGAISDKNRKFYDSISSTISSKLYSNTLVGNELVIRIVDDPSDTGRYDTSVTSLVSNLLNGDLVNAKIIPNNFNTSTYYRIAEAKLCSMILGDVNGDGIVDEDDVDLLNTFIGFNMNEGLPVNSTVTTDTVTTTFVNGYETYTNPFVNGFSLSFQLVNPDDDSVVASGTDGVLIAHPTDSRLGQFTSASVQFNTIIGLSSYKLVILTNTNQENYGGFDISSIDSITDVLTIRKMLLTGDTFLQMLRADIDGDFIIGENDGYLLQSYVNKVPLDSSFTSSYPSPSTDPYTKIGNRFNAIKLKLEEFVDRTDDYSSVVSGRSTTIHPDPDVFDADGYFASHDFYDFPVPLVIEKQLTWDESLIVCNSQIKSVPSAFTSNTGYSVNECTLEGVQVNMYGSVPDFDPGLVDLYIPNNLIIGTGGELHRPDGNFYKVDFEVGTIVLEIPDGLFGSERTINIMEDFIADYTGEGITRKGFPAMKFADCSYVSSDALTNDQVRFSVSVQSFSPNTNGLSDDGYEGIIVDGKIGVAVDYTTGLLTLNFTNLYEDAVLNTLNTKIQINVFLKKGGFNNEALFVDSTKVSNMLELISVFSGANDGGPSALVDLEADVTGILPVLRGGTGLNAVGANGTVLTSNGSSLSYQFIYDLAGIIAYSEGIPSANKIVKTDGYGLLDPSFMYKNPVYIQASSGIYSNDISTPTVIGACTFRFDNYILQGLSSIVFESIIETTNNSNLAYIKLFDVTNNQYIALDGINEYLSSSSTSPTLVQSDDIKSLLNEGATDFIYEVHLYISPSGGSEIATCKMARLTLNYSNPVTPTPPTAHSWNFVPYLPSPNPIP